MFLEIQKVHQGSVFALSLYVNSAFMHTSKLYLSDQSIGMPFPGGSSAALFLLKDLESKPGLTSNC